MKLETFKHSRRLSQINRFAGHNTVKPSNVAEHSYFVANLVLMYLRDNDTLSSEDQVELLRSCLEHDIAESITGDISYNVKRCSDDFSVAFHKLENRVESQLEITPQSDNVTVLDVLQCCDMLELVVYLHEEIHLRGNNDPWMRRAFLHGASKSLVMCKNLEFESGLKLLSDCLQTPYNLYEMYRALINVMSMVFDPLERIQFERKDIDDTVWIPSPSDKKLRFAGIGFGLRVWSKSNYQYVGVSIQPLKPDVLIELDPISIRANITPLEQPVI